MAPRSCAVWDEQPFRHHRSPISAMVTSTRRVEPARLIAIRRMRSAPDPLRCGFLGHSGERLSHPRGEIAWLGEFRLVAGVPVEALIRTEHSTGPVP